MYTNDWDPNNGHILISTDRGDSWTEVELPFKVRTFFFSSAIFHLTERSKVGGNMPGRGMGEVSLIVIKAHIVKSNNRNASASLSILTTTQSCSLVLALEMDCGNPVTSEPHGRRLRALQMPVSNAHHWACFRLLTSFDRLLRSRRHRHYWLQQ